MKVIRTIAECREVRQQFPQLALVPTMGALHPGHLSLIETARQHAAHVGVSIFVNPTQFGASEDFSRYPRPIEQDLQQCAAAGVDLVFHPEPAEMYPADRLDGGIMIDLPQLTSILEGKHRPGHFRGVCLVVAKLLNIVQPESACFGMKDFQQLRVIEVMVEALNWPVRIIRCPTVREVDGLAMSSRNRYLSDDERRRALAISRALTEAQREVAQGIRQTNRLVASMQRLLLEQHLNIDYVAAVDPHTLRSVEQVAGLVLLAIAARVGKTRLIDNVLVEP